MVSPNENNLVDAYCPIDGTQLSRVVEYDFSGYECNNCNHLYGSKHPESLKDEAKRYFISQLTREKATLVAKVNELERILANAREHKLTE